MKPLPVATAVVLATFAMSSQAVYVQRTYLSDAWTPFAWETKPIVTTINFGTSNTFYTAPTPGGTNVPSAPAIRLERYASSYWTFDFTDLNAVAFTGEINYGNYETQTNINFLGSNIYGHIQYFGVKQRFSGVGVYDEATNTFTYTKVAGASNSGGASVYSQTSAAICNSQGTALGINVCSSWAASTPAWEGLSLALEFSEDRYAYWGNLIGTDKSTAGPMTTTTDFNWHVSSILPIPAAAWLFGSAIVGLAGLKRRKP